MSEPGRGPGTVYTRQSPRGPGPSRRWPRALPRRWNLRLRLATLNIWGLPFGLARDLPQRVRAIGERLPALELDAIAFQEAWTEATRAELRAAGRRAGLVHAWSSGPSTGGGGLLVLSRLPVLDARFETYAARGIPERLWHGDYLAGKGFGRLRLQTPEGPVSLLDTHLHAQYARDAEDDYRALRLAQVIQLAAGLREVPDPVAALGDFNLVEEQLHYRVLTQLTGLSDSAVLLAARAPTVLPDNPYGDGLDDRSRRIDYVFLRDGFAGLALRPRSLERSFDAPLRIEGHDAAYSDHAGLVVELELGPRPQAAAQAAATRDPAQPAAGADWLAAARALLAQGHAAAVARRRSRRSLAGVSVGGAALAWTASRRAPLSRRRLLRGLLAAGGFAALGVGAGAWALDASASAEELRALEEARALLDRLARTPGRTPAPG